MTVVTDELVPLGTRRAERGIPAGLDCEFQEVFLLVRSLAPEELPLQDEEVAALLRLWLDLIEPLYEEGEILAEEWAEDDTPSGYASPTLSPTRTTISCG